MNANCPVENLYPVALAVLRLEGVQNTIRNGSVMTINTGQHGKIQVSKGGEEEVVVFSDRKGRRFVRGRDGVLVEKISLLTLSPPPSPPTTCEQYLREWVRTFNFPDREEGTRKVQYGEEGDKVCLLTRTDKGVIADFLTEDLKLFFDLSFRLVRRYAEYKPKRKRRKKRSVDQVRKTGEKKYKSIYGTDAQWAKQKDHKGEEERVDRRFYSVPVPCIECGDIRWVKPSDVWQVKRCKPCQKKFMRRGK